MKKIALLFLLIAMVIHLHANEYTVESPSGRLSVKVSVDRVINYAVFLKGTEIISPSPISMTLSTETLGQDAKVRRSRTQSVDEEIVAVVARKNKIIPDTYNQLTLSFSNYNLYFRAYDDGIAWRWETTRKEDIKVISEKATFTFPENFNVWFPEEDSLFTHQERAYLKVPLSEITEDRFATSSVLVDCKNNIKVYIGESDRINDYAGMFLKGSADNPYRLEGKFPGVVVKEYQKNDRDVIPVSYAGYLAELTGPKQFPWRAIIISEEDKQLIESELIYKLAPENVIPNPEWIKPGKVAWDWWNALNIYDVDFKSGVNNETYKYYIDFASAHGLEYIILDEGWYHLDDILDVVDEIDIEELVEYGRQRNVEIILWVVWKTLDEKLVEALDQFSDWGIKGIKIDFMQRMDQWMINFYEKIARECAQRELLVDFHGSYVPAGLERKFPNVVSFEGVKGMENNKWENLPDPDLNVLLPFIRMVAGPMDYTPGAMLNATRENFRDIFYAPMAPGTRCHQLAMYVIFESPLQMLADNPSNYYREPEAMQFLKEVPSVWDESKVLDAKTGEFVLIARRSGDTWFAGAMTSWESRKMTLDFNFLEEGSYSVQIWKDGVNADKHASDFSVERLNITKNSKLSIELAPGGGWVAIINKI